MRTKRKLAPVQARKLDASLVVNASRLGAAVDASVQTASQTDEQISEVLQDWDTRREIGATVNAIAARTQEGQVTRISDGVLVIEQENPQQCDWCGKIKELRRYGPNGEALCFECAMKDEPAAILRFRMRSTRTSEKEGRPNGNR